MTNIISPALFRAGLGSPASSGEHRSRPSSLSIPEQRASPARISHEEAVMRDLAGLAREMMPDAGVDAVYSDLGKMARTLKDTDADEVEFFQSHDKFTREYIYFIASVDPEGAEGVDEFTERVEEVEQSLAEPTSNKGAEMTSMEMYGQISASESLSVYFRSDGLNDELYAQASRTMEAYFAGQVTLADGTTVAFEAEVEMSVSVELAVRRNLGQAEPQQGDPLALDIDGDSQISLTDLAHGAEFDLNADGVKDKTAFVTGEDVFLALDRNANGLIDNGAELFGDQHGASSGFLELAKFDENKDGVIDEHDRVFESLQGVRLGPDGNLAAFSLEELGVSAIELAYENTNELAQGNNRIVQEGTYIADDNTRHYAADVMLNYQTIQTVG